MCKSFANITIAMVIICIMLLAGCVKKCKNIEKLTGEMNKIVGNWEWVISVDSCAKNYEACLDKYKAPATAGYTITLTLEEEGRYVKYHNGIINEEGVLEYDSESAGTTPLLSFRIFFDTNDNCEGDEATFGDLIHSDTLILSAYPCKCGWGSTSNVFVRK